MTGFVSFRRSLNAVPFLLLLQALVARGADWPMWRFDAGRTAASPIALPDQLQLHWVVQHAPRKMVWDDPLNQDLMPYDRSFEPIVVGQTMLVGFNDSDRLTAIDTRTGREKWSYYADGPVRLPAAAAKDKVYFVSDDGYLYCLRIADGHLLWKFRGGPSDRRVVGNQRLISAWPARGGPVVRDGTVYFAASIWPFMGTFIYALNAQTGSVEWVNDATSADFIQQPHNYPAFAGIAPQGALVATSDKLLIPGGRSVPACFDRRTGRSLYFHLAAYGKYGGSFVFANDNGFFAHERAGVFNWYDIKTGKQEKGRGNQPVLTDDAIYFSGSSVSLCRTARPDKQIWEMDVDASGDLIRAGDRLYAAGKDGITVLKLGGGDAAPSIQGKRRIDGQVVRLLAADDRLFAVTLQGHIMAFGNGVARAPTQPVSAVSTPQPGAAAKQQAERILQATGVRDGYVLVYGMGDGDLVEALAVNSSLEIVGVDPDAEMIDQLRRRYDAAGRYGRAVALFTGSVSDFSGPPYFASLIVVNQSQAEKATDTDVLSAVYRSLRPYGGVLLIDTRSVPSDKLSQSVAEAKLPKANVVIGNGYALLSREGPLEGAGVWTHQYGDIANSVKSDDQLVKLPLGVLWFGGSSNMDVLPRHGHGPPEQVIGGRLFIEGMDCISARDVYTGRVLWKTTIKGLDNFGVYFDETYEAYHKNPLTLDYNQVHIPGANARGTNFVATLDRVYVVADRSCHVLDALTGKTLNVISITSSPGGTETPRWGYIGVYEDTLIAGAEFADFSTNPALDLPIDKTLLTKSKWRFQDYDKSASKGLVALDRFTGREGWRVNARYGFIHNAVVVANGTLYALDKLPPFLESRLTRRGEKTPNDYRLMAIDLASGKIRWQTHEHLFGTWLSCSTELNIVLQSTRPSSDTIQGETGTRMIAYDAGSGKILWDRPIRYSTPPILHGTNVITGGKKYDLRTGEIQYRSDPLTGQKREWTYVSTKGCNYPVACENLITFRSSAAAFFDLEGDGGTGHFGGFKSGCTSNLVAADGVLNAPDYTRTCRCSFQNQTSLALVYMPDLEIWTHNDFAFKDGQVRQVGINFGAPGDRRADNGTLWMEYPSVGGPSPNIPIEVKGQPTYFRHHALRVSGAGPTWVAASGVEGATQLNLHLVPGAAVEQNGIAIRAEEDDAEEDAAGKVDTTSSDLELTSDGGDQTIGMRFFAIPIARGARIKSAYLQFQVDEASDNPANLQIHAEAGDNALAFSTKSRDISSRPRTKQRVAWEPKPWHEVGLAGPDQRTPDLSAVLQEVVDRPGWKPGNSVAFIISGSGKRIAEAYDGEKSGAPRLVFELANATEAATSARSTSSTGQAQPYIVRLYFVERDAAVEVGQRVFDVALQGKTVLSDLDVLRESGKPLHLVSKEFTAVPVAGQLSVSLHPKGKYAPTLAGIEVIAE